MSDAVEIWEQPKAENVYMIAGWRQWADAGSISSSLPRYLLQDLGARKIGQIRPDHFYLFQIPGMHHLVRPMVRFEEGQPKTLEKRRNELFYVQDEQNGLVIFLGDEPHMDVQRYVDAFLYAAETLNVKRIVGLGGVYGELPYDKARHVSAIFSLPRLKEEVQGLAVDLSDYQGGASIGSVICRGAARRELEYVGFYAFVPTYDFSNVKQIGNTIRIENDFMAWLAVMQRVDYMLKLGLDLSDLEEKGQRVIELLDEKVEELDATAPQLGVRDYMDRLAEAFTEMPFEPLDEVWEEEFRRLFDEDDDT